MEGERLIVLKQERRLVFTIMPLTVTEIEVERVGQVGLLGNGGRVGGMVGREYLVMVVEGRYLRVYDFFNLKQLCEIDFGPLDQKGFL